MKMTLIPGALMLATAVAICAEKPANAAEEVKPAAEAATPAVEAKDVKEAAPAVETVPAAPAVPDVSPELIKKNTSYGFGFQNGRQFASQVGRYGIGLNDLDSAEFLKGFVAALSNKDPEVAEKDIQDAMQALGALLEKREAALVISNLEAEKKFLAENGKRKEVTTTKSGLQYEVLAKGGDKKYLAPKEGTEDNKEFLVNYKGTLIDGKEFDKSPPGQPVPMTLQVVPGFKEAITTMPIGAKWKLFIPAALAYGEQRKSAELGPNSTLIFELELVDIKDAPPAPPEGGGFPMPQLPGQ
jgi:FKBP-type peptidyl-prolyl cis-trans isomerase